MRALRMTALIGLLVLTACQADRQATEPTGPTERAGASLNNSSSACPSAAKLLVQIVSIVKPGQGRLATAIIKFDQIILALVRRDIPKAQKRMFELLAFLVQEYNNGNLIGGKSTGTQTKFTTLTNGLYCIVGLTAPVIPPSALGEDGAIAVVDQNSPTTTVVNSVATAGVLIPGNSTPTATLITVIRLPDDSNPLATSLPQYPAFYEIHASPTVEFNQSVTVGICQVPNFEPPDLARLRVAHNLGSGIEILPRVEATFLSPTACAALVTVGALERKGGLLGLALSGWRRFADKVLLPEYAQATALGTCCVGGTTKKFSPFGAVDPIPVSYSDSAFQYQVIGDDDPPGGWETATVPPGEGWLFGGIAPFGSGGSCSLDTSNPKVTTWPLNTDILVRRFAEIPVDWTGTVAVSVAIDNDIQVFVNGHNVTATGGSVDAYGFVEHELCATRGSLVFTAQNSFLTPGADNLIAVRARDRGSISYLDVQVRLIDAVP